MTTVLISGAGIAGPSLAFWLSRYDYEVTVVEQADELRKGGSAVDFRGDQMALLERMGILDELRACATGMGDQLIVDRDGREVSRMPSVVFSGELEVERGDLSAVLHRHTADRVEYVFGDRIIALRQDADGVDVTFERAPRRRFDLVVGADGQHSGVRRLLFGDGHTADLGYHAIGFTMPNVLGLDHSARIHNEPGRYVNVGSARDPHRAGVMLVAEAPELGQHRRDAQAQRAIVRERFADMGWIVPQVIDAMDEADDLYVTSFAQVHLPRWAQGRVVLLGDAAWCGGPGSNGTGHAMLGAYTLAGELAAAGGDHVAAFARYEEVMRPATTKSQKFAASAGRHLAPPTARKIRQRDRVYRLLSSRPMTGLLSRIVKRNANTGALREYADA
ncbi:FAD-dependent monooxygenase [Pseudonocardia sp. CA-107938]|uniref:FAD-dependent monooxygenase n=1 Tax=Pseudonocardia sp. CA-107938 TaxID=3240021 RepID=UPI003D90487D